MRAGRTGRTATGPAGPRGGAGGCRVAVGLMLLLLGVSPAAAQRVGTDVLAYVGYSRASFRDLGSVELGQSAANGAIGGMGLRVPLGGPIGLRTELLLARRGGTFELPLSETETGEFDVDLVYLEIPLQLQFQSYNVSPFARPFAFGGVVPAFKLGCDSEVRSQGGVARDDCSSAEDASPMRWLDVGAVVGAGVEFRRGRQLWQAQVRYQRSFNSLFEDFELVNQSFAIMAGVGI